ncbi:hypothetical protein ASD50_21865 [Mesorhizobium sp. Root552]|nr:hypothetical protein ASD50_21865 [Mesorhizobium sp. Root552]
MRFVRRQGGDWHDRWIKILGGIRIIKCRYSRSHHRGEDHIGTERSRLFDDIRKGVSLCIKRQIVFTNNTATNLGHEILHNSVRFTWEKIIGSHTHQLSTVPGKKIFGEW